MSTDTHDDPHLAAHGDTHGHGTRRGYAIGFALSVLLTAIPFWMVMSGAAGAQATALTIFALAVVQIAVHVIFFLHLDTKSEGGWTLITFVFTAVIIGLVVGGSIWVMYHLNINMMPGMISATPGR